MPDMNNAEVRPIDLCLQKISETKLTPLDFLPRGALAEKLIELDLAGPPAGLKQEVAAALSRLKAALADVDTTNLKVVLLGGGTGLSNVVGGDSKSPGWLRSPFGGMKHLFPGTRAIVCITDDGGSTGELLKDLPFIGLGDIRRVLLSSIHNQRLYTRYGVTASEAGKVVWVLFKLFNYRFEKRPTSAAALFDDCGADLMVLPEAMRLVLQRLVSFLFLDNRFASLLDRPHCLGNLLLAVSICLQLDNLTPIDTPNKTIVQGNISTSSTDLLHTATIKGLSFVAQLLGVDPFAVLPCTTTPARLQLLYSNGALITGEHKSAHAKRNYPVDRLYVEFDAEPQVPAEVLENIREADIILLAPGSLFTSTIPILQVPGLAQEIRANNRALKILISNLWVQKGETDVAREDPGRRFYVSDLISAYHRNIPGGVHGLFQHVLALGLSDIPGSILQNYALEEKVPIYLDRNRIKEMGFSTIEASIFSHTALIERRVVQHDPDALARAVHTLWAIRNHLDEIVVPPDGDRLLPQCPPLNHKIIRASCVLPHYQRFGVIGKHLEKIAVSPSKHRDEVGKLLLDIFWKHPDIHTSHLDYFQGLILIDPDKWGRSQQWDNVFSFYDTEDGMIKIRRDMLGNRDRFEVAFLIALGESLLGDYAADKQMLPVTNEYGQLGKVYRLTLRDPDHRSLFHNQKELDRFLRLARMIPVKDNELMYTRLVNGCEGFTPPGLLFGLIYAWYLDNRTSSHIEYKMAIMRHEVSNLIPEQVKMHSRRRALIDFFRTVVFRYDAPAYE
jgi:uncharacterized cofD-like protein